MVTSDLRVSSSQCQNAKFPLLSPYWLWNFQCRNVHSGNNCFVKPTSQAGIIF
jgi:hypothetical protein